MNIEEIRARAKEETPFAEIYRLQKGWEKALEFANINARLFEEATKRAEKAESERDMAIKDLEKYAQCTVCKNGKCIRRNGNEECKFIWRGIGKEQ